MLKSVPFRFLAVLAGVMPTVLLPICVQAQVNPNDNSGSRFTIIQPDYNKAPSTRQPDYPQPERIAPPPVVLPPPVEPPRQVQPVPPRQ